MIEIRNLSKQYGKFQALHNISFDIPNCGVLGFLGRNGAGKSTTMNIITGYIAPTNGHVFFNGVDIEKCGKEAKRSTGYLPEIPPVYPDMTVNSYLHFVCRIKEVLNAKSQAHIDTICEMTGLQDQKKRIIRNLSKGYRQRVGMAQALIGNPDVIILDEPTIGLDPIQIFEIEELIRNLGKDHSVVFSSHILQEVSEVCDQVVIIDHGEILAQRSLRENGKRYFLTIRGKADIAFRLSAIEGIADVRTANANSDQISYILALKDKYNGDIRDPLFYMLAQSERPVLELRPLQDSVQDLFLQTTRLEKGEQA